MESHTRDPDGRESEAGIKINQMHNLYYDYALNV